MSRPLNTTAMRRVIITLCEETLDDALSLTAVVRDLDQAGFEVDVRTRFPEIWSHNPRLTPLSDDGECVEQLVVPTNPERGDTNAVEEMARRVAACGVPVALTAPKGDVHISSEEASWWSRVHEVVGDDRPFWIIERADGLPAEPFQELVRHFRDDIFFVEASLQPRTTPGLEGVIDLREPMSLRQFIRLVFNAQGVVCPSGFLKQLAAAIQPREQFIKQRPCVVFQTRVVPDNTTRREFVSPEAEPLIASVARHFDSEEIEFLTHPTRQAEAVRGRFAREQSVPFAAFNNRYAGSACHIVGRGPTTFDYLRLREITEPVFFLNDAVSLEEHVRGDSFFFAHDRAQQVWLTRGLKSTAVLPVGGKFWTRIATFPFRHNGRIALYRWSKTPAFDLLNQTRDQLAAAEELFHHCGTIHSVLHFVWYCGFTHVRFVGCDGINDPQQLDAAGARNGYDARLANASGTSPWWQYHQIREMQDRLCRRFGLEVNYLGTPPLPPAALPRQKIPAQAHFTWLGGPMPRMMEDNIARFRSLHPCWEIRTWIGVPPGIPECLVRVIYSTPELCMRADIIRVWLLHELGGVYLDGDMFALRNFDELRKHESFIGRRSHGTLNNAVIGATAGSEFTTRMLAEIRASFSRCPSARRRTAYGPDLLARIRYRANSVVTVLPAHYFYLFPTHESAMRFVRVGADEQRAQIDAMREHICDEVEPFAVHTWGIPESEMPPGRGRSSWVKPHPIGDALLKMLPNTPTRGANIGAKDGTAPSYLLGHHAQLKILVGTRREAVQAIRDVTRFAGERVIVIEELEATKVGDGTLDWLLIDESATHADVALWQSKLKRGALIVRAADFTPQQKEPEKDSRRPPPLSG
jgi:hypothetical protein